ncbi:26S proteasome regulatory subunit Rpn14p [Monosporozyma unispora]|nr:hypothetical protein C6P44_004689 [Kazachstania unispora]
MVRTCHIQYDFYQESIVEEQNQEKDSKSFYINVDETPESIKEFQVQRKAGSKDDQYKVLQNDGRKEAVKDDTFKQCSKRVYEATLDKEIYQFRVPLEDITSSIHHPEISWTSIARFPEGYVLGDRKGSIYVYDLHWQLQNVMDEAHVDEITSLQCFPSGTVLLSSSDDMQLKLWSLQDGSNPRTFKGHTSSVSDTVLVGRGRNFVSSGNDGCIKLWECGSGTDIHTMARKDNPYDAVNSIILLDGTSQQSKQNEQGNSDGHRLEFETQGKEILAAHESGVITLHDLYGKKEQLQLPNEFMSACNVVVNNFKVNNYHIFAGYEDGTVAQWDIRSPNHSLSHIRLEGTSNPINTMCWSSSKSSNSLYISSGIDTSLKITLGSDQNLLQTTKNQQIPQFLVSEDYQVSQYLPIPSKEIVQGGNDHAEETVIAVGNRGFISVY